VVLLRSVVRLPSNGSARSDARLPRRPQHRDLRLPPVPLGHQHDLLLMPAPLHEGERLVGPALLRRQRLDRPALDGDYALAPRAGARGARAAVRVDPAGRRHQSEEALRHSQARRIFTTITWPGCCA
jgi:hypothetical protein